MERASAIIEAEGELGDGDGVGAGRVHHDDAAMGGGGGVDVVDAYAGAADEAQLGRGLEQLGVGLHGGADDERVGVGEFSFEAAGAALGDLVGGDDLPAGFLLQHRQGCGRYFFCKNDLHELPSWLRVLSIGISGCKSGAKARLAWLLVRD